MLNLPLWFPGISRGKINSFPKSKSSKQEKKHLEETDLAQEKKKKKGKFPVTLAQSAKRIHDIHNTKTGF